MAKKTTRVDGNVKQLEPAMQEISDRNEQIFVVVQVMAGVWLIQHEDSE